MMSEAQSVRGLVAANATRLYVAMFVLVAGVLPLVYLRMPLHFDEGIFLVIGDQWANGTPLYAGMADHKPPGVFLLVVVAEWFAEYPHTLLRLFTYITVTVAGVLVVLLGQRLAGRPVGMVASLLYVTATYMPHFDGFYFLTEPFANLAIVAAALLLLADRRTFDVFAGASLAVGVLFNQTVFLFGMAFVIFRALLLLDSTNRSRSYLEETVGRFLFIGGGFLVPMVVTSGYFASIGLLDELFYYAFYLPLSGYNPPFDLYGHVLAGLSLFPIWLVTLAVIGQEGWRLVNGTFESDSILFVACWALFLGYPGATSFVGDHKLLFALPAVALLTAIGLQRARRLFTTAELSFPLVSDGQHESAGLISPLGILLAVFLLVTAGSVGVNAYYASNLLTNDISADQAEADEIAAHVHDGATFTYPTPQMHLYYHNTSITPVNTFTTVYDDATRGEIIADLEATRPPYLVVRKNHVAQDGSILVEDGIYFRDEKAPLIAYLNENYRISTQTDSWYIFERVD